MTVVLRGAWRCAGTLIMYVWRCGTWWMPVAVASLALGALFLGAAKVVVPTVVYTLF
jgi:hypothetical protein